MSKKDFWEGYVPEPVNPSQQALDKMAENARELGLDYEPLTGTQVSKVWWDGEKLMAEPIDPTTIYQEPVQRETDFWEGYVPEPVKPAQQEPVAAECNFVGTKEWGRCSVEHHNLVQSEPHKWPDYQTRLLYTSPPAQRTWVGLTDEEIDKTHETKVWDARRSYARAIEAKLKEKNT